MTQLVVRASTDHLMQRGDRFIFHVVSSHANARFVADFQGVDGLELFRTMTVQLEDKSTASVIEVPEANYAFRVVSQLEYQPPTEEVRHMVGGCVIRVQAGSGEVNNAFLSDVSDNGAGILSPVSYQRGELVNIQMEAMSRSLELQAEVRYSIRSKIAPDMYKAGLKFSEFGRLEGAVWRNFLKAA